MARFTELGEADAAIVADAFGVGLVRQLRPIAAGTINSNYALETDRGRWFLRVNEGKSERDVRYEAALVGELAAGGVSTPRPVVGRTGRPFVVHRQRFVSLFPWVEGDHRDAGELTAADVAAVGAALADLHVAGVPLASRFERSGIYTFAHILERYRGFADSDDPELGPAIEALGAEAAWLEERGEVREAARRGIIHGDLFRDNVLFGPDGRVTIIDFEQASTGSLVYDLAVCVNAWCYGDDAFDLELARAMVDGYRERRALEPAEARALYVELRAAAMRFAVTRITDVYLPGVPQEGKDFRRYLDRLAAWKAFDPEDLRALLALDYPSRE